MGVSAPIPYARAAASSGPLVGIGDHVLLGLDVGVPRVGADEIAVPQQGRGERQGGLVTERRLAGARQDPLPEDLLADAERVQVVLEGEPGPRPSQRAPAGEGDVLECDSTLLQQQVQLHAEVLAHLVAHVHQEGRFLGGVGGDLGADRLDRRLDQGVELLQHRRQDPLALGADRVRAVDHPGKLPQHASSSPRTCGESTSGRRSFPADWTHSTSVGARSLVTVTDDGTPPRTYGWRHGP